MELLSPAGSKEALLAAVQNGADAVYLGAQSFSARSAAANFEDADLVKAIEYCHTRGVKVHLALNTLIDDSELEKAVKLALFARENGIDALIIQDIGLFSVLKKTVPDLELHASTQMTIKDLEGAMKASQMGFKRVVLARECTAKEVHHISHAIDIETEVFVHGALCICYSGQCQMSSSLGGRSGNRGRCAQPCRLPYSIDKKTGFYLSPYDLCLIDELESLKKAGVASLKIEGRMKSPEYVACVTRIYRKYIDNGGIVTSEDKNTLKNIFCRGGAFTKGWYGGIRDDRLINNSSNDEIKNYVDKGIIKSVQESFKEGTENKKIDIKGEFYLDKKAVFIISDYEGNSVIAEGIGEIALNKSLSEERARQQLSRFGSSPFELKEFFSEINEAYTIPASQLNELRRKASDLLVKKRGRAGKREHVEYLPTIINEKKQQGFYISAEVRTKEQAAALKNAGLERVYTKIARNIGEVKKGIGGGFELNIFNEDAASVFPELDFVTLSTELTLAKCAQIARYKTCEIVVYGYMPLMRTKHCLSKECGGSATLKDRKNTEFKVVCDKETCTNIIYNSRPLFMADKMDEIKETGVAGARLYFGTETPEECVKIYKMYSGESPVSMPALFTRGHFYDKGEKRV